MRFRGHRSPSSPPLARARQRFFRWGRFARVFVMAFAVILLARAMLPIGVRVYVNRVLGGMQAYRGVIGNVDLNLWRGAYEIENLELFKAPYGASREPFLQLRRLDLSIQWSGLLRGRLVGEAVAHHPVIEFAIGQSPEETQTGAAESWTSRLDKLVPFRVNRFVIRDGEVRFHATTTSPPVDAYITDFYLEALNIANVRDANVAEGDDASLPAEIEAAGRPFGTGELEARLRFDPLSKPRRFELDLSVRGLQLTDLNDYLRAYSRVDAEAGTLGLYAEFAGSGGEVEGYVKTLFDGMRIVRFGEIDSPGAALEALWESLVAVAAEVLENQPHDRLATKIPLRGKAGATSADFVALLGNLLRNALLAALRPAIDDTIELRDMEIGKVGKQAAPGKG